MSRLADRAIRPHFFRESMPARALRPAPECIDPAITRCSAACRSPPCCLSSRVWAAEARLRATSTPTPMPTPPPARVVVVTSPKPTGTLLEPGGTFTVRVEDAAGQGVKGVRVQFRASSPNFTFNYLDPTTDSTGVVFAGVIYGTVAGPAVLSATADGVSAPAVVNVLVVPGPPTYLRISPATSACSRQATAPRSRHPYSTQRRTSSPARQSTSRCPIRRSSASRHRRLRVGTACCAP